MEKLPSEVQNREETDHSIGEEKCRYRPVAWQENGVSTNECHHGSAGTSNVGDVGLEPAFVREGVPGDSLCLEGFLEANKGECHNGEVDQLGGRYLELVTFCR